MRFDMGHEAWTAGERVALVWDKGHVCEYRHTPEEEEPWTLDSWKPSDKPWPWGRPPPDIRAVWNRLAGWPEGALDHDGEWTLMPAAEGRGVELRGPRTAPLEATWLRFDPVAREWAEDDDELRPPMRALSPHARLCPSPEGAVLVDPELALVWSLEDGLAWRLEGVNEEWGLQAVRVPGAILVHAAVQHRSGVLVRIQDDGRMETLAEPYGFVCPLRLVDGRVHAPLPLEGVVTRGASGHGLFVFAPEARPSGPPLIELPYGPWASELGGDLWVVNDGYTAIILRKVGGRWHEDGVLKPPKGDPTRLFGPTRLRTSSPAAWAGPPGPFEVELELVNEGRDFVGLELQAGGGVNTLEEASISGASARFHDGVVRYDHQPLRHGAPLRLRLRGQATASGALSVDVRIRRFGPADTERSRDEVERLSLAQLRVELRVRAGFQLVRGPDVLALDPDWVAALAEAGALDAAPHAPDLARWWTRAKRRCRREAIDDEVTRTWAQLSQREREASSERGVPAYKLRSGEGWVITAAECRRIEAALGPEHPLSRFARGGAFEVRSPGEAP